MTTSTNNMGQRIIAENIFKSNNFPQNKNQQ